jgi:maleylpyruvate isomerase
MPPERVVAERWLDIETKRLLETVDTFRERDLTEPSRLPNWSLGQLLTHIARNADALHNLLQWGRTGIETPCTARLNSATTTSTAVHCGALGSSSTISSPPRSSSVPHCNCLSQEELQRPVRTAHGRTIPASATPWLRLREVAVHHVDLDARLEDIPSALVGALLSDVSATLQAKPQWQPVSLEGTDSAFTRPIQRPGPHRLLGRPTYAADLAVIEMRRPQILSDRRCPADERPYIFGSTWRRHLNGPQPTTSHSGTRALRNRLRRSCSRGSPNTSLVGRGGSLRGPEGSSANGLAQPRFRWPPEIVAHNGGEFLLQGIYEETLEGTLVPSGRTPSTSIVIRWPDWETLRQMYDSPEYVELRQWPGWCRNRCLKK